MGEASLLEFDHIYMCFDNTEDVILEEHLLHRLQLGSKHTGNKIWSVLRCLARIQIIKYLLPVRVASHC